MSGFYVTKTNLLEYTVKCSIMNYRHCFLFFKMYAHFKCSIIHFKNYFIYLKVCSLPML